MKETHLYGVITGVILAIVFVAFVSPITTKKESSKNEELDEIYLVVEDKWESLRSPICHYHMYIYGYSGVEGRSGVNRFFVVDSCDMHERYDTLRITK